jgi:hypothetical protein
MTTPAGEDALRALVREVLAGLLPAHPGMTADGPGANSPGAGGPGTGAGPVPPVPVPPVPVPPVPVPPGPGRPGPAQPGAAHDVTQHVETAEMVSLRTDADLAAFVLRLLHLFENPRHRDALRAGRLRFRLAPASVPGSVRPSHRVDKGAVTEATVIAAARAGARLVLGPRAVLTPLARDRARAAGVEIEKER